MARRTAPPAQPNLTSPEQALITPPGGGSGDLNNTMMQVQRDMGSLQSEVSNVKTCANGCATDIKSLQATQHWVKGMLWGVWIALFGFGSITWYFAGDKIATLLKMADERQVRDAEEEEHDHRETEQDTKSK